MIEKFDVADPVRDCTTCKWHHCEQVADAQGKAIIGNYQYTCHRFPPSAFMVPGPGGTFQLASAFPVVTSGMVCSLHEFQDESTMEIADFVRPN